MPTLRIDADLEMHYEVDDFTDPWTSPETVVLLHGMNFGGFYFKGPIDALRNADVRILRQIDQHTTCDRDLCRQACSFSTNGIFYHLH